MSRSAHILVVNCGSSSLKFRLCAVGGADDTAVRTLAGGSVKGIGTEDARVDFAADGAGNVATREAVPHHAAAIRRALDWLREAGPLADAAGRPDAVGHRVVHGGALFRAPARVDADVRQQLERLKALAPLHNGPSLAGIDAVTDLIGDEVPNVAVFDTAFHATLPEHARRYALPAELTRRHDLQRFGFHGTSCRSVLDAWCRLTGTPADEADAVILHLGAGASATAVRRGRSVETSMGFTPLEGLMMNTRSGDLDPALVPFLVRKEGLAPEDVEALLNHRSGLRGVSQSGDELADLMAREADDPQARLAVAMYVHRIRKYLGAYLAVLEGARAVLFTGGIGEHVPALRARVCAGFSWAGLSVDSQRNELADESARCISPEAAALKAYVVPSDEERTIALDTATTLAGKAPAF